MPRRSPSPNSFERYRNSDDRGKYRSRRDDPRRGADRESQRGAYRDRRGFSERDTRRGYPDNNSNDNDGNSRQRRRGDGDDDRHRRKNGTGYDSLEEEGRRRRDEGSTGTDRRYASRHDEGDDKRNDHSRRGEYGDRGGADRDRPEDRDDRDRRERERDRGDDERRGSPRRRSASPRRSRPHSRSRSPSAAASPPEDKTKPNFAPSGLLAAATNTVRKADGTSTLLKYNEPPEARKPLVGWRLYVFKGDEQVDLLHIHRQSAYLIGRDPTVTDIPLEHPSCSKQHAVIQYRLVQQKDEFGSSKGVIKPFVIDLESTNGTHVNGDAIPTSRYYELKASDVLKFGTSNREYVLLHDEVS
ncbi:SMAD/FHA domain-containing protein [Russula ochroleuca]|uniref:SMAD/FHA domain-containing protein n=1 Tax=Russula ochroleuca TaxID=152965 RepID=A0A9P5JXP5_9AGAM|nr:SMAD/FHA domain-containing protein [Russula ochroleuca]